MNILAQMQKKNTPDVVMAEQIGAGKTVSGMPDPRDYLPGPRATPTVAQTMQFEKMTAKQVGRYNLPKMIQPGTLDDRKPKNVYTGPPPNQTIQPGGVAKKTVVPGQPTRAPAGVNRFDVLGNMPGTIESSNPADSGPKYPVVTASVAPIVTQPKAEPIAADIPIRSGLDEQEAIIVEKVEAQPPILERPQPTAQEPVVVTGARPLPIVSIEPVRTLDKEPVNYGGNVILEPVPVAPAATKNRPTQKATILPPPDVVTATPIPNKAAAQAELSTMGIVSTTDPIIQPPSTVAPAIDPVSSYPSTVPSAVDPILAFPGTVAPRELTTAEKQVAGYQAGLPEAAAVGGLGLLLLL